MPASGDSAEGRLVVVGEVMGAIGTGGDLRVKVHNPDSALLLETDTVVLRQDGTPRQVRILDSRPHGKGLRMRLDAATNREQARALYGAELCVAREQLPPLEDDEFYVVDLLGARAELEDGTEVGTVSRYLPYPSADVVELSTPEGPVELPLMEPYLCAVDVEGRRIIVAFVDDLRPAEAP